LIANFCWIDKKSFTIFVITDKKRAVIPRSNYIHAAAVW